jgi:hypothetical protein
MYTLAAVALLKLICWLFHAACLLCTCASVLLVREQ